MQTPITAIQKLINRRSLHAVNSASSVRPWPAARLILCGALLFAFAVCAACVSAQQPLSLAYADLRAESIFQQSASTGMALVVVRNREVMPAHMRN
jgi:hypothetical protein